MRILSEQDCMANITVKEAITESARAFHELAQGKAQVPDRIKLAIPNEGVTLFKPAVVGGVLGQKVVSVRDKNAQAKPPLPTVPAVIMLIDTVTGFPSAVMGGTYLTALRTAAGSAVATNLLAKENAKELVVFGAGDQAKQHVRTILAVRPTVRRVVFVNRTITRANELKEELRSELPKVEFLSVSSLEDETVCRYLSSADIVVTATGSKTPVLQAHHAKLLQPNTHINAVGTYTPDAQEMSSEVVAQAAIALDCANATESGDLHIPLKSNKISNQQCSTLIGQLLNSDYSGNQSLIDKFRATSPSKRGITLFKSVGTAVQDVTTAERVFLNATKSRSGFNAKL